MLLQAVGVALFGGDVRARGGAASGWEGGDEGGKSEDGEVEELHFFWGMLAGRKGMGRGKGGGIRGVEGFRGQMVDGGC